MKTGNFWVMYLDFTRNVMEIMTKLRKDWGLICPKEK